MQTQTMEKQERNDRQYELVDILDAYRRKVEASQGIRDAHFIDIKEMVKSERDRNEYQLGKYLTMIRRKEER